MRRLLNTYSAKLFLGLVILLIISVAAITPENEVRPVYVPGSAQRSGDADAGFNYIVTGDYLKSGIALSYYNLINGKAKTNPLGRSGKNAEVPYNFNVVKSDNGIDVVAPSCLQCHAQVFNDSLIIGLGNTSLDFSNINKSGSLMVKTATRLMQTFSPKSYEAAAVFMRSAKTVFPQMQTEVQGVNAADRLATVLVAYRDPVTLEWQDKPTLDIPDEVVPTDVPAWWLLKKKNAMFYNGLGRGDFGKFLMLSNMLTVKDSAEAAEVSTHFGDVLAYLLTIKAPVYPKAIDQHLAASGRVIFANACSKCHGRYGEDASYPNLLIPGQIIKTDSLLYTSNYQNPQFIDWFNKSWYAGGTYPAKLQSFNGYIAPPLDGVWITAPYLHNGSVPTLEALLNSNERPTYWQRDFKNPQYDYENVGWQYAVKEKADSKKVYNTTLPGYGNKGHYFGDWLSAGERKAVIEYLKTL